MTTQKQPQADLLQHMKDNILYDKEDGSLRWIYVNNQHKGRPAGKVSKDRNRKAYVRVQVKRRVFSGHVIAWFLMTGEWLPGKLDHINGDGTDNRIVNLRVADRFENMKNKRLMSNNSSGVCGIALHKRDRIWEARICVRGKRITIGRYKTKDAAIAARKTAEREYNFHPNHGQRRPL